jgi:hypothetical protein
LGALSVQLLALKELRKDDRRPGWIDEETSTRRGRGLHRPVRKKAVAHTAWSNSVQWALGASDELVSVFRKDHVLKPSPVLCAGMFRSGSTWAFNVTKQLLATADPETEVEAGYFEGEELEDMLSYRSDHHRVIKCHFGTDALIRSVDSGVVDSVIYSQRDPMAALASCVEQFCSRLPFSDDWTFETAVERVGQGSRWGLRCVKSPVCSFSTCTATARSVRFWRSRATWGSRYPGSEQARILEEFSFAHMRERSGVIASVPPEDLMRGINDPRPSCMPVMSTRARIATGRRS